jgi:hypothetical protein
MPVIFSKMEILKWNTPRGHTIWIHNCERDSIKRSLNENVYCIYVHIFDSIVHLS